MLTIIFLFNTALDQATDLPVGAKAEKNFYKYKEDREEMIKMMIDGELT